MERTDGLRLAAVGDLHCTRRSRGQLQPLFAEMNSSADVMLLCGDLTEYGLPEEAQVLAAELRASVEIPVVAVLGNHDYESGREREVTQIMIEGGVTVLDGGATELGGVGFAGVKGFGGGFSHSLEPWGEPIIKQFVQEAVSETLKLESALARLSTPRRVALLHYAPVHDTIVGEAEEIVAFLGSRRLEEPLTRFGVSAVFHGHSHFGRPEGRTASGAPVFNGALPLLRREFPARSPFRLFDMGREQPLTQYGESGGVSVERKGPAT